MNGLGLFYFKGTCNSNGLIILISKSLQIEDEIKVVCSDQRMIGIEFSFLNIKYIIINIYAPHKKREKVLFYEKIFNFLNMRPGNVEDNIIICGDFNSVLSNAFDIISGDPHSIGEIDMFESFVNHFDLYDVWRNFNIKK